MNIDLVLINSESNKFSWGLGAVHFSEGTTQSLLSISEVILKKEVDYFLTWDAQLGFPDEKKILELIKKPGHIWHAGLQLNMAGHLQAVNYLQPTWMLNRDPTINEESTSWRLSLRACLFKSSTFEVQPFISPIFLSLESAALELGYRLIKNGAIMRNIPSLLPHPSPDEEKVHLSINDELTFAKIHYNTFWYYWFIFRYFLNSSVSKTLLLKSIFKSSAHLPLPCNHKISHSPTTTTNEMSKEKVSLLIPTLNRYPYLKVLFNQIRTLNPMPFEIIIIDQSSKNYLNKEFYQEFSDLPLKVSFQKEPGQCTSRNFGINQVHGDYILFIDDDDEIKSDLIKLHLSNLKNYQLDVSSGIAHEAGQDKIPENFTFIRMSDVFPTNNTMIKKEVLLKSGLFDLAYNRGSRADSDLGMRIYLTGSKMLLNPSISVFHHHAPSGGLREHKARVITYASSRKFLTHRHIPSITEIYKAKRYFTNQQVNEMLWISIFSTFQIKGSILKRLFKFIISTFFLPYTLFLIRKRKRLATNWLKNKTKIPLLKSSH